jgi:hypothetical protein
MASAHRLCNAGYDVEPWFGLGGTLIGSQALKHREIDVNIEYTRKLLRAILKLDSTPPPAEPNAALARDGVELLGDLGFDNTYALAMMARVPTRWAGNRHHAGNHGAVVTRHLLATAVRRYDETLALESISSRYASYEDFTGLKSISIGGLEIIAAHQMSLLPRRVGTHRYSRHGYGSSP